MDTVDLLLAQMNYKLDHWDVASKLIARVLISKSASRHIKDKALDLKNEIIKNKRCEIIAVISHLFSFICCNN